MHGLKWVDKALHTKRSLICNHPHTSAPLIADPSIIIWVSNTAVCVANYGLCLQYTAMKWEKHCTSVRKQSNQVEQGATANEVALTWPADRVRTQNYFNRSLGNLCCRLDTDLLFQSHLNACSNRHFGLTFSTVTQPNLSSKQYHYSIYMAHIYLWDLNGLFLLYIVFSHLNRGVVNPIWCIWGGRSSASVFLFYFCHNNIYWLVNCVVKLHQTSPQLSFE